MTIVHKALALAREAHKGQKRKYTGEPYLMHPMRVSLAVSDWGDQVMAAALLHDVLEDCPLIREFQIHDAVGDEVLSIIKDLTNPSKGMTLSRSARKIIDRDHYVGKSIEVCTIKAWDRIDNLLDMSGAPDDFKALYATESRALYHVLAEQNIGARLAQRLAAAIETLGTRAD